MTHHSSRLLTLISCACGLILAMNCPFVNADEKHSPVIAPIYERFATTDGQPPKGQEVPDFQRHVTPLLGRLGCNGRACHGSFQGQGGFQLSLFGYDFKADYEALLKQESGRVNTANCEESLILAKPIDADMHEGGKRFEQGGWEYWVLRRWIEAQAPYDAKKVQRIERLEVTPAELRFTDAGETQYLRAIAHWEDGSAEDVTCLCRFQSNDSAIADIDETGKVTSGERGDTHVVVSYDNAVVPVLALRPMSSQFDDRYPPVPARTTIDELVVSKLRKLGIIPADRCTDEEFLRRASLDVTGTLPTTAEVLAFMENADSDKRQKKIEELLARPSYVAQWTTFLCDITGNNDEQLRNYLPNGVDPSKQWYQWIFERLAKNVPYDEIVEGMVTATSRKPGESYREYCESMTEVCQDQSGEKFADRPGNIYYWARNNFKTTEDRVIGFAYSFLGVRIQCAQCHKHPFDQWSKSDFENFERLFGGIQANQNSVANDAKKEYNRIVDELNIDKNLKGNQLRRAIGEMMMADKSGKVFPFPELVINSKVNARPAQKGKDRGKAAEVAKAKLLGGDWVALDEVDVRRKLMDWLRSPSNPYFAKAIVNRVWAAYFGIGIVNPADDLNLANAPSNEPLLDYLANGFRENNYDFKWLHREILNSDTYQRSWVTNETNQYDKRNFSRSLLRRIPAESTHDAVYVALANDSIAARAHDLDIKRAIARGGASPQAPRDDMTYALSVFGRSTRESNCDCDRSSEPSLLQTVFLVNDRAVLEWLSDDRTSWVAEVAAKYGWPVSGRRAKGAPELQNDRMNQLSGQLDQQLTKLDARLAKAEADGDRKQASALMQRKEQIVRQLGRIRLTTPEVEAAAAGSESQSDSNLVAKGAANLMTDEQALWVTEQAYLRSLSRKPSASEVSTAMNYLRSEANPTTAVENLLWGLVNTKEFIINH
jgi:hypothetical protein